MKTTFDLRPRAGLVSRVVAPLILLFVSAPVSAQVRVAPDPRGGEIGIAWKRDLNGMTATGPVRVIAVVPCSPAHRAGLLPGDRIEKIDGEEPGSGPPFGESRPGISYTLDVVRGKRHLDLTLVVGHRGTARAKPVRSARLPSPEELGCNAAGS